MIDYFEFLNTNDGKVNENFNMNSVSNNEIEQAVNDIILTEVPQFEGYKYPKQTRVYGDINLPYYALIFIMKI